MKKILSCIISLMIMLCGVGCMNNSVDPLPINPDSSNSTTNAESSSNNSIEIENGESSKNEESSGENDDSSSNKNENETDEWTGFY